MTKVSKPCILVTSCATFGSTKISIFDSKMIKHFLRFCEWEATLASSRLHAFALSLQKSISALQRCPPDLPSRASFLSSDLSTFPEPPWGNDFNKLILLGTLYDDNVSLTWSFRSSSLTFPMHWGFKTTQAYMTWPSSSASMPKTAAWFTAQCVSSAFSTSFVYTFSPPTITMSAFRSTIIIYPLESTIAMSPVVNHPESNISDARQLSTYLLNSVIPLHCNSPIRWFPGTISFPFGSTIRTIWTRKGLPDVQIALMWSFVR